MSDQARADALRKAFAELDIGEDLKPHDRAVERIVEGDIDYLLKIFEIEQDHRDRQEEHKPNSQDKKTVAKILRLARDFDNTIRSMPVGAIKLLSSKLGPLPFTALGIVAFTRIRQFPHSTQKGGRPIKADSRTAARVADAAASAFTLLTGKPATPGSDRITGERSQFERFLTGVYEALGISASSEVHARERRRREKTRSA